MAAWPISLDCTTCTPSQASFLPQPSAASSAILTLSSSPSNAAEKNLLWPVRRQPSLLLRSSPAMDTRPRLRRPARLPGVPRPTRLLSPVPCRETRTPRLVGRQPALHPTLRHPGRPLLSPCHRQGRCRGLAPRLAFRQGTRQSVHAGTTRPAWQPRPP